jgi:hypothetical protein
MKVFHKDSFAGKVLPEEKKTQKTVEPPLAESSSGKNPLVPEEAPSIPATEKGAKNPLIP